MSKATSFVLLALWGFSLLVSCDNLALEDEEKSFSGSDVTSGLEVLGNVKDAVPASVRSKVPTHPYARNIWDMQVYDGRIFLGYGCWSNNSPSGATNAGPLPILALDLPTKSIVIEEVYAADGKPELSGGVHVARDEQLWRFRVINGRLYAPGCDPRMGWELGDIYVRRTNGTWLKKRTIPGGVHVLDLAAYNGKLYAAIGPNGDEGSRAIMCSDDAGDTWYETPDAFKGGRVYTLVPWKGLLYGFVDYSHKYLAGFTVNQENKATFTNFRPELPDADIAGKTVKVHAVVGDTLAFTLGVHTESEGLSGPGGLFYSKTFPYDNKRTYLPNGAEPIDIISRGNFAYILAYLEHGGDNYTILVYRTENFEDLEECFRFTYGTFARSFEEEGGDFYFGMGSRDTAMPTELAGTIIRIPYAASRQ